MSLRKIGWLDLSMQTVITIGHFRRSLAVAVISLLFISILACRQTQMPENKKTAVAAESVTRDDSESKAHDQDHTEKPASWLPARPMKTTVSSGSARILDDLSIRLEGDVTGQELTAHFAFDNSTTLDELRLELLPVDSSSRSQFGRGGEKLILFDVKAGVVKQTGEWTSHEFSGCVSLLNPDDETTTHCIDYLSDTGWTIPVLPADALAHTLVLRFDEPVTLQPDERLLLTVDSGGSRELAVLNLIRFAFHQAAAKKQNNDSASSDRTEAGTVVLHAIDADTGEPISDVAFVKENALREDWATPVGRSGADGTLRIQTKPMLGSKFDLKISLTGTSKFPLSFIRSSNAPMRRSFLISIPWIKSNP